MNTRISIPNRTSKDITITAQPSYDKPGEQSVVISIAEKDQTIAQMFLDIDESFVLLDQLAKAIEHIRSTT